MKIGKKPENRPGLWEKRGENGGKLRAASYELRAGHYTGWERLSRKSAKGERPQTGIDVSQDLEYPNTKIPQYRNTRRPISQLLVNKHSRLQRFG
jgi:hypothetical protein